MELPTGFQKLLKDFDPKNLNKIPAAEIIKAFSLLRDMAQTLEIYAAGPEDVGEYWYDADGLKNGYVDLKYPSSDAAENILKRYKEWK